MRSLLRIAGGALLLTLALAPRAALAAVTGSIEGTVTDQSTGKRLAGVTVTVTSPALQGEQTEFTDAGGHYVITELPPGEYLVRFYYSNINVERPGVFLQADKTLSVNVAIPTQKAEVKTYRITEKAPTVDVGNTQVQTQVTSELVRNTPVRGRSYDAVLTLAPGSGTDAVGFEFGGATGLENSFLIDGVNTTSPALGRLATNLTLEFIGETEIITGGYNAEYGRATGGVVNVITKSGSNQFHGDIWFYVAGSPLFGPTVGRSGEAIAIRQRQKYQLDFGFDVGGPILKDKIWFYAGFAPTFTTDEAIRVIRTRTNLMDDMSGGYLGDLDTNISCPGWIDQKFCSTTLPGSTNPALIAPGYITNEVATKSYTADTRLYNWIAKLNFQLNPNNSLVLQYIGSPQTRDGFRDPSGQGLAHDMNGDPATFLLGYNDNIHDALLHFISKLADRKLQLDVILGYHYQERTTTPRADLGGNDSLVTDTNLRSLADFDPTLAPCAKGSTGFNPCPVQNYNYGGYGGAIHAIQQRVALQASATYFARLGGTHALKLGYDFEWNNFYDKRKYTGGGAYTVLTTGEIERNSYSTKTAGATDDPGIFLPDGFAPTTATLNHAVYLRDSYNVGFIPGLTLNAGVRWEAQQVKAADGSTPIGIYDNWAPRVGAIYDFTRKGRSKIYASYGWFYESIPLDMNDRQFSGEGIAIQTNSTYATDPCAAYSGMGKLDPKGQCMFPVPLNGEINGGAYSPVAPHLKGQYSQEVVAGIQYDVGFDLVLGASYIHRDLGRVIEDMSFDGGNTYIIGNPGTAPDPDEVKNLQKQIAAESDPMKKAALQETLYKYNTIQTFEKPKRDYDALVITANKRLSHNFLVLASYTYSRTIGNYPGLYQASDDQRDPNISTQFDLRELLINRAGPLPTDRPHNLKLQGSYFIPFGNNTVVVGLAFNGLSGRPIEVLGRHPLYGRRETFVLPRGSGGRTPFVTTFDLHLSYKRQLNKVFAFEAYGDIFNLFNQQAAIDVDDEYTASRVGPILNGTVADLVNLKTTSGTQPLPNPNYGRPSAYQAPISMRLGLRLSF